MLARARSLVTTVAAPGSVDMAEVAEIVRNHEGYPIPLGAAKWSRRPRSRASLPGPYRSRARDGKR